MLRTLPFSSSLLASLCISLCGITAAEPPGENRPTPEITWHTDYGVAYHTARGQGRMMLIHFCDRHEDSTCKGLKKETLEHPSVCRRLQNYVCVELPLDAGFTIGDQQTTLLKHSSFREMLGRPGIAVVDFLDRNSATYGDVVSTFPITRKLSYTPERIAVILDLPPGTITQRTLIYAVRIHPDRPQSTAGQLSGMLAAEADSHSGHQARIRLQGHHQWETRFHQINAKLPPRTMAVEVCAESWPGENLVEAAIECVRCWRLSSGHWSAVRASHAYYGYDMKRGSNRIWYATGILGKG